MIIRFCAVGMYIENRLLGMNIGKNVSKICEIDDHISNNHAN